MLSLDSIYCSPAKRSGVDSAAIVVVESAQIFHSVYRESNRPGRFSESTARVPVSRADVPTAVKSMPEIEINDDDRRRIETLREELQAKHGGPYTTVETSSVIAYLLDLAEAVDEPDRVLDLESEVSDEPETENQSADDDSESEQLNAMLNLLDTHDEKWHTSDGDARYEVELPDGSVESARTKDDVRALLFKHY